MAASGTTESKKFQKPQASPQEPVLAGLSMAKVPKDTAQYMAAEKLEFGEQLAQEREGLKEAIAAFGKAFSSIGSYGFRREFTPEKSIRSIFEQLSTLTNHLNHSSHGFGNAYDLLADNQFSVQHDVPSTIQNLKTWVSRIDPESTTPLTTALKDERLQFRYHEKYADYVVNLLTELKDSISSHIEKGIMPKHIQAHGIDSEAKPFSDPADRHTLAAYQLLEKLIPEIKGNKPLADLSAAADAVNTRVVDINHLLARIDKRKESIEKRVNGRLSEPGSDYRRAITESLLGKKDPLTPG